MTTTNTSADIRFLKIVLTSLILCTLVSGFVCVRLASAEIGAGEIRIAAQL